MILYVVRHGETNYNLQDRYAGSLNIPLNERCMLQASQLADKLKDITFDTLVTSPLLRAKQTAEIISRSFNIAFIVRDSFAERNMGVYEGLTVDETKLKYPTLYARKCTRQLDDAPTNGETIRQFDLRISKALNALKESYPNNSVLLVCHGFVARIINRKILGISYDDMHHFNLNNCEIVKYYFK